MCRISGRQGWSDKSWLEDVLRKTKWQFIVIASIPRLHPKYTSLIALHWHWQTPESIGRYCYLPPLVMATPCCPPHIPHRISTASRYPEYYCYEFFCLKTQYWGLLFQGQLFSWLWTLKLDISLLYSTKYSSNQAPRIKSCVVIFWNVSAVNT